MHNQKFKMVEQNRKSAAAIMNFNMEGPDKACVVISILNYADITLKTSWPEIYKKFFVKTDLSHVLNYTQITPTHPN